MSTKGKVTKKVVRTESLEDDVPYLEVPEHTEAEIKLLRKDLINKIKTAKISLIKVVMQEKMPFHLIAQHDEDLAGPIIALWYMGYFPNQISRMSSVDELAILGIIRNHYADIQQSVIPKILKDVKEAQNGK
jgi:hypothetical protein